MPHNITALIIACNAERTIRECVKALHFCDRIVVGENGSTDQTAECAKAAGADVQSVKWQGYGTTKNQLILGCESDWILSIDSDEIVTTGLAEEIQQLVQRSDAANGYRIRRRNFFLNKEIKFCGWGSDWQLRLFKKGSGLFEEKEVHEALQVTGEVRKLKNVINHYSYPDLNAYMSRLNHYTTLAARDRFAKGKPASLLRIVFDPGWTFFKMAVLKSGWRDGFGGLVLCLLSAFNTLVKHAKHWELSRKTK